VTPADGDVRIVVVTFNSAGVLADCLRALPPGVKLTVVDNSSTDGSAALAATIAPQARVVPLSRNIGFGNAANAAFADAAEPYGLLLNPDARAAPDMLDRLREAAGRYPDAAMLAPAVRRSDGGLDFGRHGLFDRPFPPGGAEPVGDCCCPYVGGPAMFLRLAAFRAIGGFDPDLFLYAEDDDLCFRFRRAGLALVHVAAAELGHLGASSTSAVPALDHWKAWHVGWSRLHVTAKHRGAWAARRFGVREVARRWLSLALRPGDRRAARWRGEAAGMRAFLRGERAMANGLAGGGETATRSGGETPHGAIPF